MHYGALADSMRRGDRSRPCPVIRGGAHVHRRNDVGEFAAIRRGFSGERQSAASCRRSPNRSVLWSPRPGTPVGIGTMLLHAIWSSGRDALLSRRSSSGIGAGSASSLLCLSLGYARPRMSRSVTPSMQVRVRLASQPVVPLDNSTEQARSRPAGETPRAPSVQQAADAQSELLMRRSGGKRAVAARLKTVEAREAFMAFADAGRRTF